MIKVINFKYKLQGDEEVVNTTSRSSNWSRGLSPFYVGPVDLYDGYISQNAENGWQHSKLYSHLGHLDEDNNPTSKYWEWAQKGWASHYANRYPAGKENIPVYSYWAGEKLSYLEARKRIYIPLYSSAVQKTNAFNKLQELYYECKKDNKVLYLQDFDSHNVSPEFVNYEKMYNNENIKMGHAYVLAMMLEGISINNILTSSHETQA